MYMVTSDASATAYGVEVKREGTVVATITRPWPAEYVGAHSTACEASAMMLGLRELAASRVIPKGSSFLWATDCVAARAILEKLRSQSWRMFRIGLGMVKTLSRQHWRVEAVHILGVEIGRADYLSRGGLVGMREIKLHQQVFEGLEAQFSRRHTVDLFASAQNRLVTRFLDQYSDARNVSITQEVPGCTHR